MADVLAVPVCLGADPAHPAARRSSNQPSICGAGLPTSHRDARSGGRQDRISIKFREGDFWYEMAEEFNRVTDRIRDLEPTPKAEPRNETPTTAESVAV